MAKATIKMIGGGAPFMGPVAYQVTSGGRVTTYSPTGLALSSKPVVMPKTVTQVAAKALTPPTKLQVTLTPPAVPKLAPVAYTEPLYPPVAPPVVIPPITSPISPVSTPASLPNNLLQNATARQSSMPGDTTSPTLYYPAPVAAGSSGGGGGIVGTTPIAPAGDTVPSSLPFPGLWLAGGAVALLLFMGRK